MFTQKLSMDCTQEQYEKYLKEELEEMGYREASKSCWDMNECSYIANCWDNKDGQVGNIARAGITNHNRTYLGKFNAPLFLALAAMTDKTDGGYGEWWICKESDDGCFTKDCLYRAVAAVNHMFALIDNVGKQEGYCGSNHDHFRKATVSEIMAKFGEPKVQSITIAVDITNHSDEEQTFVATEKQMISFLTSRGYNVSIVNDSPALENILAEKNMITRLKSKGYRIFKQTTTLEEV